MSLWFLISLEWQIFLQFFFYDLFAALSLILFILFKTSFLV